VVTGIVGRKTFRISFTGEAGHSGTTDMYRRRDALRGAALCIVRMHDTVRARYGDGIFNCGDIEVKPGAFNIIPCEATITTEIRHVSDALLYEMETMLTGIVRECAASYSLQYDIQPVATMPAASMSAGIVSAVENAAAELGLRTMPLISYAGHAAQVLSKSIPCGMIFIPSQNGIGHHPDEFTPWENVVEGANVLLHSVLALASDPGAVARGGGGRGKRRK
jgi:hydantoinase/carbamoylase family amidase